MTVSSKRHIGVCDRSLRCAVAGYIEIFHVASVVAFGISQAVLLVVGIKVAARRFENQADRISRSDECEWRARPVEDVSR